MFAIADLENSLGRDLLMVLLPGLLKMIEVVENR